MAVHVGWRGPAHQARTAMGGGGDVNAETTALVARFANPPAPERRALIDACIGAIKAAGVWTKLDALYVFAAHDSQAARENWIQNLYNATESGSPTFTTDRGYTGDGASAFIDTNAPNAGLTNWTLNSACFGGYINQDNGSTLNAFGNINGNLRMSPGPANVVGRVNSSTNTTGPTPVSTRLGHSVLNRTSSTATGAYRNGVLLGSVTAASGSLPVGNLWVLHQGGAYTNDRVAAFHVGAGLSDAEVAALYAALQAYLTDIGGA